MDYFKLIDAYIDGELTGSELSDFIKEMERNSELAREVELYKDVNKFLYKKADELKKREDLNRLHEEFMKSRSEKENKPTVPLYPSHGKKKNIYYYITAAASIIIVIGIYFLCRSNTYNNEELFATYYMPYEESTATRGGSIDTVDSNTLYNKAIAEYEALQFSNAAKYFEKLVQTDSTNYEAYFLLGVSYIETNNISGAIHSFLKIIRAGTSLFEDNARWYLGLCYLKADEQQNAIEQFRYLETNNAFCRKQSAEILSKIGK
jgi:tetratricopeptide (TPR) repeat protein